MKKIFTVLFAAVIALSFTTVASAQTVSETEIEITFFKGLVVTGPDDKPDKGGISTGGSGNGKDISVLEGNELTDNNSNLGNAELTYAEPSENTVLMVGNPSNLGKLPKTGSENTFALVLIFMGALLITTTILKNRHGKKGDVL